MTTITLSHLGFSLSEMRSRYQQGLGKLRMLQGQVEQKESDLAQTKKDIALWQQVQALLNKVSEFARQQLKLRIEETVSAALQAVFERDDIAFEIEIRISDGQPAANWQVVSMYGDTSVAGDPESSRGGGVSDIVSLALRLALLELARPKVEGPVLLDEVGKHISAQYAPNVAQFLKQYAAKTGRQIILVTHMAALAEVADVSYRVSQDGGVSEVTRL